jgi:hypothetical protein
MAHSHAHAHAEGEGTYFLDQLFTILACGGVGLVAVLMYQTGMLSRILVPMFFVPTLLGGVALLVMVVIRGIAVWQLAGARKAAEAAANSGGHEHGHSHGHAHAHDDCGHEHSHGDDCGHDHAHAAGDAHAHTEAGGDDHDHGWAPWRYMVIAVPVFLYFLGLPREGLWTNIIEKNMGGNLRSNPDRMALSLAAGSPAMTKALRKPPRDEPLKLAFSELTAAAAFPVRHDAYEGDAGMIRGQFVPVRGSDREFTLLRVDRKCCVADEIYLETRIQAPDPIRGIEPYQWVVVEGLISFEQNEKGKWIPVITPKSNADIRPAEPAPNANEF